MIVDNWMERFEKAVSIKCNSGWLVPIENLQMVEVIKETKMFKQKTLQQQIVIMQAAAAGKRIHRVAADGFTIEDTCDGTEAEFSWIGAHTYETATDAPRQWIRWGEGTSFREILPGSDPKRPADSILVTEERVNSHMVGGAKRK